MAIFDQVEIAGHTCLMHEASLGTDSLFVFCALRKCNDFTAACVFCNSRGIRVFFQNFVFVYLISVRLIVLKRQ